MDFGPLKSLKQYHQEQGAERRASAAAEFADAARSAAENGMRLVKHNYVHYSLIHSKVGWGLEIYPGNQRLYRDCSRPKKSPHLQLPEVWGLLDIVNAAAKVIDEL